MRQKMKRIISALLAGVLTFSGLLSSFPSYAEEGIWYEYVPESVEDEAALANADEPAEPQKFNLTLLYDETVSFTYDTEKFDHEDEDTKDVVLSYEPDEKVEISLTIADGMDLSVLRLVNLDKKDYEFTWDNAEMKLSFQMPSEDAWIYTETEEIPAEEPAGGISDLTDGSEPAIEEDTSLEAAEGAVTDESGESVSDETIHEEDSAQPDVDTESEQAGNDEIDDDGLPSQGSVVTVDAISIPFDTWDFDAETDFTNIDYDPDLFTISYVSDDIVYDQPGTYSSIYHVTDNASGKFWFVLRPVIVTDAAETETEAVDETETAAETFEEAETEAEISDLNDSEEEIETEEPESELSVEETEYEKILKRIQDLKERMYGLADYYEASDLWDGLMDIWTDIYEGIENGSLVFTDEERETLEDLTDEIQSYLYDTFGFDPYATEELAANITAKIYNEGGNTISSKLKGVTRSSVIEQLSAHINDDYYIGTPYGHGDYRNPNGDCSNAYGSYDVANSAAMNCTGFVWHVLYKASSYSYEKAYSKIPCWSGAGMSYGWATWLQRKGIEYKTYVNTAGSSNKDVKDLIAAVLEDDYIQPFDVIWIWDCTDADDWGLNSIGLPATLSGDHHIGFYIGDYFGGDVDTWWNSIGTDYLGNYYESNVISNITPKANTVAITVAKLSDETYGNVALKKSSTNTGVTNGNAMYSLEGAEYGVYTDKACTTFAKDESDDGDYAVNGNAVLVTDSKGNSNTVELNLATAETYYIKEISAPAGYELDSTVYTVTLSTSNTEDDPYVLEISDEPLTYPTTSLSLEKTTPYDTSLPLSDAQFEVKFYAGAKSASGTPTKTWVLKSDESYNVIIDNRHKVSGDSFYTNSELEVVLPLGYYTIQEIVPPEGYQLSEDIVTYTVTDSNGSAKLVTDGSTVVKQEPVISDEPIWGGIEINKRDIETEDGQPQGDAVLEGAVYNIINMNDYTVSLRSDPDASFATGEVVMTLVTDETGHAESGIELEYGSYTVVEAEPPTGYTSDGENTVFQFTIENNDEVFEYTVKNRVIRFDIQLIKFRDTLSSEEATDDVEPIEGVTFGIYLKRTDEMILTITTDEEGVATTADPENYPYGRLPYGTYVIRELEYPDDVMPVEDFEVFGEIDGKTYSGIYKNDKPIESGITVVKTDAETGKIIPLAGTEFQILDENGEVMTFDNYYPHYEEITNFVTDDSGSITLPEKLPYGTYYLHEVNAPYGYLLAEDIAFEITEFNYWPETVTVELPDYPEKGRIVVSKYDADTEESISGAVFAVFADEDIITADGTVRAVKDQYMEVFTIGEDGTGMSSELYLGTYYVQEIQAPSGYCLDDTRMRVTLEYEDQETPVTYAYLDSYNTPTTVIIRKTDEEGEALEGVKFEITPIVTEEEPEETETEDSEITENESELIDDDIEQTEGAIESDTGVAYESEEYVTDADGLITKSYLKPGIYRITETQTLEHYILDDTARYVTVDRNGFIYESDEEGTALDEDKAKSDTVTLTWVNEFSSVPVEVSKKEITGEEELPGAKLSITDEEGNLIDEWTSTTEPHKANLFAGTYTLTEITAPTGYATAESIEFTIDSENVVHGVTMYDSPLVLEVSKKDITDNEELPGAHLRIEDEDGNKIDEWTSTDEPHVIEMIPAGNYRLIETTAPDGYATAETVEFTVTDTAEIQHVEMTDSPTQVEISKKDITDDEELPGAHLIVKDKDGDTVDEWTSTTEPHVITNLPLGTYTLTEVTAPEGYDVAETITFTVEDTCDVQHVQMYDSPKEDTVDLTGLTTTTTATPTSGSSPSSGGNVTASSVKTGDYFRYGAAILLVACGAALLIFTIRKRKQTN